MSDERRDLEREFVEDLCRAIDEAVNTGPYAEQSINGARQRVREEYDRLPEEDREELIERIKAQGRQRVGTGVGRELDHIVRDLRDRS